MIQKETLPLTFKISFLFVILFVSFAHCAPPDDNRKPLGKEKQIQQPDGALLDEPSHTPDTTKPTPDTTKPTPDTSQPKDTRSRPDTHTQDTRPRPDTHTQDTKPTPDTHTQDTKPTPDTHTQDTRPIPDTAKPKPVFCGQFDTPNELISDRRFRRGFIAMDQTTRKPVRPMPTGLCKEKPIWNIAQWDSLGDLSKTQKQTLANGSVRWSNPYGRVTVGRGANADLAFGVWAYKEYGGKYHVPNPSRVWVHMLAEQRITEPWALQKGCPPLSSLSKLNFKIKARLLKDIPHKQAGYDRNKHAAQFLIYFTVQNLNKNSKGFGDYLWLGITPYDDRDPLLKKFVQGDLTGAMGTGKLIYNLGAAPFISTGLTPNGSEQTFAKDILPDVRKALLEAWKRGYLPHSKSLSDYRIGGMNIGWEVPGLNDVEMRVRDLSLRYSTKSTAPIVYNFNQKGNREGWTAVNLNDFNGGPSQGKWILRASKNDPYILSPKLSLDATTHKTIQIVFANDRNPAAASKLQVYWERFGSKGFREAWSASIPVKNNGGWYTLTLDMSKNAGWSGEITRIRIDPILRGDGHSIGFDKISFQK